MPRRSTSFQRLIVLLTAVLADRGQVTESAMLVDKVTGEQREVDILISVRAADYDLRIGIEVVGRNRPAGTPWVECMHGRFLTLPIDKLVLVSERGFTAPALQKARFLGIEALTIEAAMTTDWPQLADVGEYGFFEETSFRFTCSAILLHHDGQRERVPAPLSAALQIGASTTTVGEFARQLLNLEAVANNVHAAIGEQTSARLELGYTDPHGMWKVDGEMKTPIQEVRIAFDATKTRTPVAFGRGKYRSTPFVSGTGGAASGQMQFVLTRRRDGGPQGLLVDPAGVRQLSPFKSMPGDESET